MWNHNAHFHSYLLRQCPVTIYRALDVGCGLGVFAQRLAERAEVVDAIDADSTVVTEAVRGSAAPNVHYLAADFLEADLPEDAYDVIVAIASLHHMNLEAALAKMKTLLRSSGTLIILGLYREATLTDYAYRAISIPLNYVYLSWHQSSRQNSTVAAPPRSADSSLDQIRVQAKLILPNFQLRRHLFWRYSLIWDKP